MLCIPIIVLLDPDSDTIRGSRTVLLTPARTSDITLQASVGLDGGKSSGKVLVLFIAGA